jgi:hypothetical protein
VIFKWGAENGHYFSEWSAQLAPMEERDRAKAANVKYKIGGHFDRRQAHQCPNRVIPRSGLSTFNAAEGFKDIGVCTLMIPGTF